MKPLSRWLRSDRMGLRLEGPPLELTTQPDRLSAPVAPGAIQVAGGQLILLGVACGTMGGYPHVAHVISADLDRVGQLCPGDQIAFRLVDLATARNLDLADPPGRPRITGPGRKPCRIPVEPNYSVSYITLF